MFSTLMHYHEDDSDSWDEFLDLKKARNVPAAASSSGAVTAPSTRAVAVPAAAAPVNVTAAPVSAPPKKEEVKEVVAEAPIEQPLTAKEAPVVAKPAPVQAAPKAPAAPAVSNSPAVPECPFCRASVKDDGACSRCGAFALADPLAKKKGKRKEKAKKK